MKTILFIFILGAFVVDSLTTYRLTSIPGFSLKNIVLYLSFLVLLCTEVTTGRIRTKMIPGLWIFFLFCLYVMIQIIMLHVMGSNSRPFILDFMHFKWGVVDLLLVYVIAFLLVDDPQSARNFFLIIIVCFSLLNILAIASSVFKLNIIKVVNEGTVNLENRFVGSFGNPNQTAYFLCILIPYMYYFIKHSRNMSIRLFLGCAMIGAVFAILLSGSRGGLLCLLFLAVVSAVVLKEYKTVLTCCTAVFVLLAVMMTTSIGRSYLYNTLTRTETIVSGDLNKGSSGRLEIWQAYISAFIKSPENFPFGVGYGYNKTLIVGKAREMGWTPATHNYYLETLTTLGIIGLLFHVMFFGSVYHWIHHQTSTNLRPFKNIVFISVSSLFIGWCFTSMFVVLKFVTLLQALALAYLDHAGDSGHS